MGEVISSAQSMSADKTRARPIIMTPHSVTATLGGSKTQTRRLVDMTRLAVMTSEETREEDCGFRPVPALPAGRHRVSLNPQGAVFVRDPMFGLKPGEFNFCCPYVRGRTELVRRNFNPGCWTVTPWRSAPAARLWVKERWDYFGGNEYLYQQEPGAVLYFERDGHTGEHNQRAWRTPLFMPRWASRLTLEVIEVRLQRLKDMSDDDAIAEGVAGVTSVSGKGYAFGYDRSDIASFAIHSTARDAYAAAWGRIHGRRALWESNPWVWAITYRRI